MKVQKLLDQIDQTLVICRPDDTIYSATMLLSTRGIGAIPVCEDDDRIVGIISERDVIKAFAHKGGSLGSMRIEQVMSTDIVSSKRADSIESVELLMRKHRIRHVPIVEQGSVIAIISIRDLLAARLEKAHPVLSD